MIRNSELKLMEIKRNYFLKEFYELLIEYYGYSFFISLLLFYHLKKQILSIVSK